ncbi:hypothetical protein GLOTRDRAFT_118483 [Gloeophyllum trabeum ATCC 11539]|uniref:F-box domain-containing protein n=1 Tax=Gloeophyllum trabeum (strain ATCC 11539 / FP-39264 / Madison 617) TaxID=670483 RepID=S7QK04_GLOTA|nr:uncharacterized protein GLOTRDRAFT_118483 [Gloeophyllum trabeum ATCC 11539]EPQ60051.1 hypothetical protein GLOTRDRAFT_118483 [Gloeophyllum trabeum ATCC 11539]
MFPLAAHNSDLERFAVEGALATASFVLSNMGLLNFKPFAAHNRAIAHDIQLDLKAPAPARRPRHPRPQRRAVPLPAEIILHILEAAYFSDALEPDDALLRSCALVCRAWAGPAQKLLFRSVTLRSEAAFASFRSALDMSCERGRALAESVTRLRAVLDYNQPGHLSETSFARAVAACPKLYELGLHIYGRGPPGDGDPSNGAPSFNRTTLALLRRAGPRIAALHFSNASADSAHLFQLLALCPSLHSLSVRGVPPHLPPDAPLAFASALHALHMDFQSKPSTDFLNWLLQNSARSLRVLEFAREPSTDMLAHLVGRHAQALQSLALPSCGSREAAAVVRACTHLKEFRVEHARGAPAVWKALPEGIQHIALGVDAEAQLEAVLGVVKEREELEVVTLQMWEGGAAHPALPSLRMECATRGIELRITRDVRVFRTMVRGDPVPTDSFPRTKSLSRPPLIQPSL